MQARARRQEILDRDDPPQIVIVLDEAAVRRQIGGPAVMRRQLERLEHLSAEPFITIQVMTFDLGAHPGLLGPFILLEFPEPGDNNVLYLESLVETVTRDNVEETAKYLDNFFAMEARASAPDQLSSVLFPS